MRTWRLSPNGRFGILDTPYPELPGARETGEFLWVELDHPDRADFIQIERDLGLHPLAVEDAVLARDRPKLDVYDGTHFVTLITVDQREQGPSDRGRIMAFVGDSFAVTVRQEHGDTLARARRRLEQVPSRGIAGLDVLHAVLDTVVDDWTSASRRVEASILASADRLFSSDGSDEAYPLYRTTLDLLAMAHAVQPLIEPLRHLSRGMPGAGDVEAARRFQDILDHALVLDREIHDYSELVEHLRDSNDSRIALRQNTDMRKISAWAAIIAVPTAITGFYGMNVPYPGFGEATGVVAAAALQTVLAGSLFAIFRRRRWL